MAKVERPAHPVENIHDMLRPIAPADAQPAKPVKLGKGARHHHVLARLDKRCATVIAFDIFAVCAINHQQCPLRQVCRQPRKIGLAHHSSGRVVGVGDEHQASVLVTGRQNGIHIGHPLALAHLDWCGAIGQRADPVHGKAVLGMDHLVAGPGIGLAEKRNDLIAADTANDPLWVKPMHLANRGPQADVIGRRIAVQLIGRLAKRLLGRLRGAKRVLVRAELDHIGHALDMRCAALVRRDLHNARLRYNLGHIKNLPSDVLALALTLDQYETKKAAAVSRRGL